MRVMSPSQRSEVTTCTTNIWLQNVTFFVCFGRLSQNEKRMWPYSIKDRIVVMEIHCVFCDVGCYLLYVIWGLAFTEPVPWLRSCSVDNVSQGTLHCHKFRKFNLLDFVHCTMRSMWKLSDMKDRRCAVVASVHLCLLIWSRYTALKYLLRGRRVLNHKRGMLNWPNCTVRTLH